jgi:hypothetical protein
LLQPSYSILSQADFCQNWHDQYLPAVRDLMQTVVLQDGTVLTPSDGSIHFLESKRCVTIFTAPGAPFNTTHYNPSFQHKFETLIHSQPSLT